MNDAAAPLWFKMIELLAAPAGGIVLYMFGRSTKSGANQLMLDQACADIKSLQEGMVLHGRTAAAQEEINRALRAELADIKKITYESAAALARIEGQNYALLRNQGNR